MERSEKVAYYCSELGKRLDDSQQATANNNNNNNVGGKVDLNDFKQDEQQQIQNTQTQDKIHSATSSGEYPWRMSSRGNQNQVDQQRYPIPDQQQGGRQFVQSQAISSAQQQQSMNSSSGAQQQYLISNSNSQQLTNMTLHHFSSTNNTSHQNQLHSSNYLINSNHHLYQASLQQQHQTQSRTPIAQHHKSPSTGTDGGSKPHNQVIFNENNKQLHQLTGEQELLQRQQLAAQYQQTGLTEQTNLTSSQSMTQGDFNKLRRKAEQVPLSLTSEVGLESLNLEFEAMLMNDGQQNANNQITQKQQQLNSGQNIDKLLRNLVNQQNVNDAANCNKINHLGNELSTGGGYGRSSNAQHDPNYPLKDAQYMGSEDNIYEEIDQTIKNRLQAGYPYDTISAHSDTWKKKNAKKFLGASFTRWFSTRKKSSNSQNSDQEEISYIDSQSIDRPRPISLPDTVPDNLTPEKLKRRLIVGSIVDSENSYRNSLFRLIYDYKKPLWEADPPILSRAKIEVIFLCLDKIHQIHKLLCPSLSHHISEWDEKEMIGSVFVESFSKPHVLEYYSEFINNFTNAMETARRACLKSKAFAQFLQDKSISSSDRLSFFGSMVKPVQRFPQFILLLSDLLKHTPFNHPDRLPLQRALTELETLADRLNERKRDAERHFAVKQLLKDHLNESDAFPQRFLLRQDDTCLLDIDPSTNTILKSKTRKMYLLNDMLICVSIPSNRLKFAIPLSDITVIESITPAITNLLAHSNFKNLNDNAPISPQNYTIERMECERQSLVHDLELMMSISALVSSLRFVYNGLNPVVPEQICMGIREEIRKKEFQMTLVDRSCLQLHLHSKNHKDTLVVQFSTPDSKREWLVDVRLTKLALDRANNPGWENITDNPPPTHQASLCSIGQRVPLFVKSQPIFGSSHSTLTCALHYYLRQAPFIGENPAGVLWIGHVDANVGASALAAFSTNGAEINLIHEYDLANSYVTCIESAGSLLWVGLRQNKVLVLDFNYPGQFEVLASLAVQSEVTSMRYFGHFVYVGLSNGTVAVFDPMISDEPYLIQLSQFPVTCLMPINDELFACSHNRIWRIKENSIVDSLLIQNENIIPVEEELRPNLLAHCGSGIWVSLIDSPIVKLYHAETLKFLVDINVGNSIRRVIDNFKDLKISVTSLMATRGLLWIGTNVGMIATLTLPRLQGVPSVSGSINVALHRFLEPVNVLLNLSAGSEFVPQLPFDNRQQQLRPNQLVKTEDEQAIYGQYADLMNVGDYITTGRKSGPESHAERIVWEYPSVNISSMNTSDDSGSNASSGAIYQDGVLRGMKQQPMQSKNVVTNTSSMVTAQQHLTSGQQQQQQVVQNQLIANNIGQTMQQQQQQAVSVTDPNHIYDRAQTTQSVTYNQGSLNGVQAIPHNIPDGLSLERLQKRQMLSTSQTQLANTADCSITQTHVADCSSQSSKAPNKLYDQPAQLLQQKQQLMQQSRQATNQVNGAIMNIQGPNSGYGTLGSGKVKNCFGSKTVLVLAGGTGYQRMALGDDLQCSGLDHCIIWEYKA